MCTDGPDPNFSLDSGNVYKALFIRFNESFHRKPPLWVRRFSPRQAESAESKVQRFPRSASNLVGGRGGVSRRGPETGKWSQYENPSRTVLQLVVDGVRLGWAFRAGDGDAGGH